MKKKKIPNPVKKGVAKVPVIMQLEALECGAASLAMILAYYGKWIPLEKVRSDCGVSRDGSNAKNVLLAARYYGFDAKGYRMEPEALKEDGVFPCIIHWNFNHFVVLDGFRGDKVYLNDPARGNVTVDMQTFDESFTGIVLTMEPGESFEPGGKKKSVIEFAKKRLKGSGPAVAFVVISAVIGSLFSILQPGFSKVFLDRLLSGQNEDWTYPFIIGLSVFSLLTILNTAIHEIYARKINGKMSVVGSTSFLWKILKLPMEFYSQRYAGDILARQDSNASVAASLVETFAPLVIEFGMMVFYLVIMIRFSLILTLVGIASIFINIFVSRIISNKRINVTRVQMRDAGKLVSATVNGIGMIETIKASGAEDGYFQRWSGYQASVNTQKMKFQKINVYLGIIPAFVTTLANILVVGIGVWLIIKSEAAGIAMFTIGSLSQFKMYLGSVQEPASTLISAGQTIQEMRTEMERIEDVMEYPDDVNAVERTDTDAEEYGKLSGSVELKNVTFGYARLSDPLIENFSMTLKPGSRVAFVGGSGCGKSTLAKLISGLYQPWSGEILFDGKRINEIDKSVFRGSLAVVDQDIILFEDSIGANIRMWDKSVEDFEVIMAARDAQIHEDIMQREGGYNYKLIEGGRDFSGGQRQRMEIARVLAQDPTIVILDEATSALDATTEFEVVKSIRDRGITCIVVAHRLSTIRDCDEIIVLDHGKVVERGTHEELMKLNGEYVKLVSNE